MKNIQEIKLLLEEQKPYLAGKYGVVGISLFGSYARNEQHPESDLDVLIELEEPPRIDLLDLVNLESYLSALLGMEVDIAIKSNLRKRIGQRILSESIPV